MLAVECQVSSVDFWLWKSLLLQETDFHYNAVNICDFLDTVSMLAWAKEYRGYSQYYIPPSDVLA